MLAVLSQRIHVAVLGLDKQACTLDLTGTNCQTGWAEAIHSSTTGSSFLTDMYH